MVVAILWLYRSMEELYMEIYKNTQIYFDIFFTK